MRPVLAVLVPSRRNARGCPMAGSFPGPVSRAQQTGSRTSPRLRRGADGKPDLTGVWDARPVVARPDPANLQPWSWSVPGSISRSITRASLLSVSASGPRRRGLGAGSASSRRRPPSQF